MDKFQVKIIELEAMRVAVAHGYGESPEIEAWQKILDFLKRTGKIDQLESCRFFGYNNPNPSPGSPNYGYDQWVTITDDIEASEDIRILDFPGGLYAVTSFQGLSNIGDTWGRLVEWHEDSPYKKPPNYYQCLEEVINPQVFITPQGEFNDSPESMEAVIFKLYLPITS
jgi:effector-binding domain-containing protein